MSLNKKMGDAHEAFLCALFDGTQSRGSGNQWANPMDGRQNRFQQAYAFAWDGKSTLGGSIGVTRAMWRKAREQAHGERPMLGLRFYDDESLKRVEADLVVLSAHDMAEVLEAANTLADLARVIYQGGQSADAVRREALALLEKTGHRP